MLALFLLLVLFCSSQQAAASAVSRVRCSEAQKFGTVSLATSATSFSIGDLLELQLDFTCANSLGYPPLYADIYLRSNKPVLRQGNILLLHHEFAPTTNTEPTNLVAEFAIAVPDAYYDTDTTYTMILQSTYGHMGPNGGDYHAVGQVTGPDITIVNQ